MSWQAWFTAATVCLTIGLLVTDRLPASMTLVGATVLLLVARVITPADALGGFSNPAPATIGALFVLARAVERTGALSAIVNALLGHRPGSARLSLIRLLMPTAASSAFLNNTPIVAMLVPPVQQWAGRQGYSSSQFLMPLSFASILGGTVTLMGTGSHLVCSGLVEAAGQSAFGVFELGRVGLPIAVVGVVYLVLFGPLLLPARRSARGGIESQLREFAVDMVVKEHGPLDGKNVEQAALRNLDGVFLAELQRNTDGHHIAPVRPDTLLAGGDRLRFVGKVDQIVDLQRIRGLTSAEKDHLIELESKDVAHFEAVVGADSPLLGKTLKEAGFRRRYDAAVLAIHRAGHRVDAKLGQVEIRMGDTLLMVAQVDFRERWRDRPDFLLIAPFGANSYPLSPRVWLVALVSVVIVALAALRILPLVSAALLGAVSLVVLRVLSPTEARASVSMEVLVTIGAAFGLAAGVNRSGLAQRLSSALVGSLGRLGSRSVLAGLVIFTMLLKEVITNNAAAVLVMPVALSTATALGLRPRPFSAAVALSAATSFLTPIGYQTNIMVYGPGGYRFADYLRLGGPLSVIVAALIIWLVPRFWLFGG